MSCLLHSVTTWVSQWWMQVLFTSATVVSWVVLHTLSAHWYAQWCAPVTFWDGLYALVYLPTIPCSTIFWLLTNARSFILSFWSILGAITASYITTTSMGNLVMRQYHRLTSQQRITTEAPQQDTRIEKIPHVGGCNHRRRHQRSSSVSSPVSLNEDDFSSE